MLTLALDASTYTGTVAVIAGGTVLAERETAMRGEQEERLMPAVAEALADAAVAPLDVRRVVCGAGPGRFTSLRIAVAIGKGIASAAGAELVAVPSLLLIVAGARSPLPAGHYLPVLDAMRGDCFVAHIEITAGGELVERAPARLVARHAIPDLARDRMARVIGAGESIDGRPHARGAVLLGGRVAMPPTVDLATWEPDYGRLAEAQLKWELTHGRTLM